MATSLAADDDHLLVRLIAITLGQPYRVIEARNGLEAARIVERDHPDLAVLDVRLPFFGGMAACERIKARTETRDVPVLVITGGETEKARERALAVGADGFLAKPFSPAEFQRKAEELLAAAAVSG